MSYMVALGARGDIAKCSKLDRRPIRGRGAKAIIWWVRSIVSVNVYIREWWFSRLLSRDSFPVLHVRA